jgi:hypothetical protein
MEKTEALNPGRMSMSENRYSLAGWLSLAAAILFPLGFVIGIAQGVISAAVFEYTGPIIGPSDLLFIAVTAIHIYAIVMLRKLLHEHYEFFEADTLITLVIWWNIAFQVGGLLFKALQVMIGSPGDVFFVVFFLSFMVLGFVSAGIINLMLGIKLLKLKDGAGDLMKAYSYVVVLAGGLQLTVVLAPLSLILVPVLSVILGMLLLKESESAEFV